MTVRAVHDLGDHFLLEDDAEGFIPAFKDRMTEEEHAAWKRMADGGEVTPQDPAPAPPAPAQDLPLDAPPETPAVPLPAVPPAAQSSTTTITHPDGTTVTIGPGAPPAPVADQVAGLVQRNDARTDEERGLPAPFTPANEGPAEPPPPDEPDFSGLKSPTGQPLFLKSGARNPAANSTRPEDTSTLPPGSNMNPAQPAPAPQGNGTPGFHDYEKDIRQALGQETLAAQEKQQAENSLAGQAQGIHQNTKELLDKMNADAETAIAQSVKEAGQIRQTVMHDVDPQRLLKQMGPFGGVLAVLGLGAGTFGSALAHSPNAALEVLEKAVDNDLRAQERNQQRGIDLLHLNLQQRQQLIDQFNLKKANILTVAAAAMEAASAKTAPGMNRAIALDTIAKARQRAAQLGQEAARSGVLMKYEAPLKALELRREKLAFSMQQNFYRAMLGQPPLDRNSGEIAHGAVATAPQLPKDIDPVLLPRIQEAMQDSKGHGVIQRIPTLDTDGFPLKNPDGSIHYTQRGRWVQSHELQEPYLNAVQTFVQIDPAIRDLADLIQNHPEGAALDRGDIARAEQLKRQMAVALSKLEGSSRTTDAVIENAKEQIAGLDIVPAFTGRSTAELHGIQRFVNQVRDANDTLLFPDISIHGGRP